MITSSLSQRVFPLLSQRLVLGRATAASASVASSSLVLATSSSPTLQQTRTFILDGLGGSGTASSGSWHWPVTKRNTILNIVPEGHKYVVERFGKLHSIRDSGYFFAIPVIDSISYVIDMREKALDIAPQSAITRDNVAVEVAGNLFVRFFNPERAAYGAMDPLYSVTQHSQSVMRSAIGEMELDEILHGRSKLNTLIKGSLQEAAEPWGMEIRRYEVTEITPDPQIRLAMDKQAAAERDRRENVLRAEGEKRRAELTSEGVKISLANESEGNKIKVQNEAEAEKTKLLLEAEGQAAALKQVALAQAEALKITAEALNQDGGEEAARLLLAKEYVSMYGQMGQQSNTMLFQDRPADVTSLLAQSMAALTATQKGVQGGSNGSGASGSAQ